MADGAEREKVTIRALLQSVKYGLSPEQLWRDYIRMIGEECQYRRYGHNSFIEFLQAMPDVVRFSVVRGQTVVVPVATAETKHIAKMVASQKCTAGSNVPTVRRKPPADTKMIPLDLQAKVKRILLAHPNGIALHHLPSAFAKRYGYNLIPEKFGYMSMEVFVGHGLQMDIQLDQDCTQIVRLRDTPPAALSVAGFRPTVGRGRSRGGGVQGGRGQQSRRAEAHYAASVSVGAGSKEDQLANKFGMTLSLNDIDRSPIGPPKPLPQQQVENLGHSPSKSSKPVPESFKGVLWRLLKQYPGGIPLPHFQEYYRRYAHEDLPVLGLGFSSVEEFLAAVPDVLVQHKADNGCVMLVAAPSSPTADEPLKPLPEEGPKDDTEAPLPVPNFEKASWPKEESVNVLVTHVVDPGHFYVQVIGKDSLEPLHTLQEDMTMFYSSSASAQQYYLANVKKGQVCVAVFPDDNSWYRAEIISVPDENRVSVRYVDYGNTATVSRMAVRRAKAHYFSLPVQALECTCAKIKPEGSQFWSAAATEYFRTMTERKVVVAFVKEGQGQVGRLPLSLCDTSTEEDVFLSEELVRQGLAELDRPRVSMAQQQPCVLPPTPNQSSWPSLSQAVTDVTSVSHTSPPLPSSQVPYYMVHPQLWSSYLSHVSTLPLQQGAGLGADPYFGLGRQMQQPYGMEAYPVLTPTSDCMGVGMGMPMNIPQANQSANVWLPSDDTELDATLSPGCPQVRAAEEAVGQLINERRRIIQSMTTLSDQSGTLSTAIDQLSAMEAQIRAAENKLHQLRTQQMGQGTVGMATTRPAHLDLGSPHPWPSTTSVGIGRGQPLLPQSLNPAAPGGLADPWVPPTSRWQPQSPATGSPQGAPHGHLPTGGEDRHASSGERGIGTGLHPSVSSPASHPQEVGGLGKLGAPPSGSESQKSANIGIGRGSTMRALCAQAGLDWI